MSYRKTDGLKYRLTIQKQSLILTGAHVKAEMQGLSFQDGCQRRCSAEILRSVRRVVLNVIPISITNSLKKTVLQIAPIVMTQITGKLQNSITIKLHSDLMVNILMLPVQNVINLNRKDQIFM